MSESIRCPACRGSKIVAKLGGMIGECNTCTGKGTILACDKPKPIVIEVADSASDVIASVADCVPATTLEEQPVIKPEIKVNGKKALYKRKKA